MAKVMAVAVRLLVLTYAARAQEALLQLDSCKIVAITLEDGSQALNTTCPLVGAALSQSNLALAGLQLPPTPTTEAACPIPTDENVKCLDAVASPRGFIAYKINYNVAAPGYFDLGIVRAACAAIGAKPLCNQPYVDNNYCDARGYMVPGSYLSQCGYSSNPAVMCAGLEPDFLLGSVLYSTSGWKAGHMLGYLQSSSSGYDHEWVAEQTNSAYHDTICAMPSHATACDVSSSDPNVKCLMMEESSLGFVAYRINYNLAVPGYFNVGIVRDACAAIGAKPLCNKASPTSYCDSSGYRASGSYFSQCNHNTNGPSTCAGLESSFLLGSVLYSTSGWKAGHMLGYFPHSNSAYKVDHAWVAENTNSAYHATICAKAS